MEPGHHFLVIVAAIITTGVTLSTIVTAHYASRKASGTPEQSARLEVIEARLARMEEAIESVAVEIERVAEGQRFTARLLADRTAAVPAPTPRAATQPEPRMTTPH